MCSSMRLELRSLGFQMAAIFYPAVLFQLYLIPFKVEIGNDAGFPQLRRPYPNFNRRVLSPTRIDPNNSFARYLTRHQVILRAPAPRFRLTDASAGEGAREDQHDRVRRLSHLSPHRWRVADHLQGLPRGKPASRVCLTCGNVGCCEQSVNKHASAHFAATRHPVARSKQPGEAWRWCYADEVMDDPDEWLLEGADLS